MFKLKIETGNDDFEDDIFEIARILNGVISKLNSGVNESKLLDNNGNVVGSYKLTKRG